MLSSFIITFRETLEAALVVGIVLSYLLRTKQSKYNNVVYLGIGAGIAASIIGALLFNLLAGGFTGRAEEIFEGVIMLIGAALLTTMIFWMMQQKHLTKELENQVNAKIQKSQRLGLFLLIFTAVLREGIETVIFLGASSFASGNNNIIGALAGIIAAIILGYAIFVSSMKINLKKFFNITSIVLILFAAGLVAHGIHELEEAKIIPSIVEHLWNINPPVNPDGNFPIFHEDGLVGSFLKGLLGYNGNPSLLETISYLFYMFFAAFLWKKTKKA